MSQKVLWAPWRMEYLRPSKQEDKNSCIFCDLPKNGNDSDSLILHRKKEVYVILNKFPYNSGHLMVVPFQHTSELGDLSPDTQAEMMHCASECISALSAALSPNGFNMGINLGQAAGAGIPQHIHFHIVPRWTGDTNFMPVLSETKSLPQHLRVSYDLIKENFSRKE